MAGASFTTSIPLELYASLVAESRRTGESRNAVVRRALESALDGDRPASRENSQGWVAAGKSEAPARADDRPPAAPAQTRTSEESALPTQDGAPGKEGPHDRAGMRTSAPRRSATSAQAKQNVKPLVRKT